MPRTGDLLPAPPLHRQMEKQKISFGQLVKTAPVSCVLLAISMIVWLLYALQMPHGIRSALYIDSHREGEMFASLLNGELWRLITPIFLHFGFFHILFNMLCLLELGFLIELVLGSRFMIVFVLVVGTASNLAEYVLTGDSRFGGMSGVIYGLFGYVMLRGRFDPGFGIALPNRSIAIILGWYVICWIGVLGPIANWAHTAGLLGGIAWAGVHLLLAHKNQSGHR